MDDQSLKELWEHPEHNVPEKQVDDSLRALLQRINLYEITMDNKKKWRYSKYRWLKIAGILLLPILASYLTYYYTQRHLTPEKIYMANIEYTVLPGEKKELTLPDGTSVALNSGSILIAPEEFAGNKRSVYLIGEAYFKVAKDATKPFIVSTPLIDIQALGTEFCVTAYQQSNHVQTTLTEGKVLLSIPGSTQVKPVVLHPSEQSYYDPSMHEIKITKVNVDIYTSWKDDRIIFEETPFEDVIDRLRIQFGWRIICDKKLYKNRVTAKFIHGESLTEILDTLQEVINFTYKTDQNIIYIQ